ncbi:MAG TPA: response regulator transcription factor [Ktedonobacteraceae bacterium]|nr:response regulator transcription factor [Ktedonobacteraceae bacterium]
MQRILVIDDDATVTNVLKRGLSHEGFLVETAHSGAEGLVIVEDHLVDLVILDVMMPRLSGLEVLHRLRVVDEHLPILLLTAKDTQEDQVKGLESGADDYVVKPFSFVVLVARVRALLRRQWTERSPLLRFANLTLDVSSHDVRRGEQKIPLTNLEFKLLQALMAHPRQVLSKEILLDRVWGYDFRGNGNVVEVYVMQLRQKLEVQGEARLIHTLWGVGYMLREEEG